MIYVLTKKILFLFFCLFILQKNTQSFICNFCIMNNHTNNINNITLCNIIGEIKNKTFHLDTKKYLELRINISNVSVSFSTVKCQGIINKWILEEHFFKEDNKTLNVSYHYKIMYDCCDDYIPLSNYSYGPLKEEMDYNNRILDFYNFILLIFFIPVIILILYSFSYSTFLFYNCCKKKLSLNEQSSLYKFFYSIFKYKTSKNELHYFHDTVSSSLVNGKKITIRIINILIGMITMFNISFLIIGYLFYINSRCNPEGTSTLVLPILILNIISNCLLLFVAFFPGGKSFSEKAKLLKNKQEEISFKYIKFKSCKTFLKYLYYRCIQNQQKIIIISNYTDKGFYFLNIIHTLSAVFSIILNYIIFFLLLVTDLITVFDRTKERFTFFGYTKIGISIGFIGFYLYILSLISLINFCCCTSSSCCKKNNKKCLYYPSYIFETITLISLYIGNFFINFVAIEQIIKLPYFIQNCDFFYYKNQHIFYILV